jgi:hypothetical protein
MDERRDPIIEVARSTADLRRLYPEPVDLIRRKALLRLDSHCRKFVSLSPLIFISTSGRDGRCDVSARGDAPGFVAILDDRRLAVPDRPGNNRIDALNNIVENGHVGLVFVIPGRDETLRINGAAAVAFDRELLARLAVKNVPPRSAIVVEIEEAFLHCGRAFKRGDIWNPERYLAPGTLPPFSIMLADHTAPDRDEARLIEQSNEAPLY